MKISSEKLTTLSIVLQHLKSVF